MAGNARKKFQGLVRIRKVEGSIPFGSTKMNDPTQFEQTLVVVQNGWGHFMPELLALQGVQAFLYFIQWSWGALRSVR